jgi:hypothetical protein
MRGKDSSSSFRAVSIFSRLRLYGAKIVSNAVLGDYGG